jgi:plasmid maintenance system antidote protein VapI
MTSIEYLDRVKTRHGVTDYGAAPLIGITKSQVSAVRTGKSGFGEVPAMKIARLLDLNPHEVLANLMAEKAANDEVKTVWKEIAAKFAACALIAIFSSVSAGYDTLPDPPKRIIGNSLYYVKSILLRIHRHLSALTAIATQFIAHRNRPFTFTECAI